MDWIIKLLPFIMDLFEDCDLSEPSDQAAFVKDHPNIVRARVRRGLQREGKRGRELRAELRDLTNQIQVASHDDICCFLEDIKDEAASQVSYQQQ